MSVSRAKRVKNEACCSLAQNLAARVLLSHLIFGAGVNITAGVKIIENTGLKSKSVETRTLRLYDTVAATGETVKLL